MLKRVHTSFFILLSISVFGFLLYLFLSNDLDVLSPSGLIARQQRDLLVFAFILSMFVILPVFILTAFIAYKYRDTNKNNKYRPENDGNKLLETLWWGIPMVIILVLSIVTFKTSHSLEPSREIASSTKPLQVEVIALQWNWLFLYPEQGIATTNYLELPVNRPVAFSITSDAPMNSFWIPKLGGQIYAMSGMTTRLYLQADEVGQFRGSSANISGEGFSGMNFKVNVNSQPDFDTWLSSVKTSNNKLNRNVYSEISRPGFQLGEIAYSELEDPIFDDVRHKYDFGHDHGITYQSQQSYKDTN